MSDNRRTHGGDSAGTLVSASGYQEDFARPTDLSLAQPCFGTVTRIRRSRQRIPKIQDVLWTELGLVERFPDGVKRNLAGPHSSLPDRTLKDVAVEFLLRCHVYDRSKGRSHVYHSRKFGIATGLDAVPVEDDRYLRI